MKIVIIGGGKVGSLLASELTEENHDVVIVDNDRERLKLFNDTMDVITVFGNGALAEVQRQADVDEADLVIAATAEDELNMLACFVARKLGCPNTIARVRNRGYAEQLYMLKDDLGLSMVINPELLAAKEFYGLLQMPAFMNRDTFAEGRAENVEFAVHKDSVLNGLSLKEIPGKIKLKILVCAVIRDGKVYIPDGSFVLREGDKIYVTAPANMLADLAHALKLRSKRPRDVLIVGGGKIAEFLVPMLLKSGTRVKIIEKSRERCDYLAELMPDANIICSDGSSQSILKMHNIERMDAVLPLTNMDEENIIIAMFARKVGVPQVLTKINRLEYGEILGDRDADALVSPKQLSSFEVVRFVRAMENTGGSAVITVYKLAGGNAEAQEFAVTKATRNLGVPLMKWKLKTDILIACISRKGKVIIPGGADFLQEGDTVVVVTAAGRELIDLNDIFA